MHVMINPITENDSLLQIQGIVNEYGSSCFTNNILAIGE